MPGEGPVGSPGLGYHIGPKAKLDQAPSEDTAVKFLGTGILHCYCCLSLAKGQDLKPPQTRLCNEHCTGNRLYQAYLKSCVDEEAV